MTRRPGSTSCVGGAGFVTNPTHQLKGVWTDAAPVPDDIVTLGLAENLVDDPIAQEAIRASAHFKYDASATYIILALEHPVDRVDEELGRQVADRIIFIIEGPRRGRLVEQAPNQP